MGQLLAQHCQITLGVALAHEYRQISDQPGEMAAAAERRGPQRTPDVADHAFHGLFHLGTRAAYFETGIYPWLPVDPGGAFAQRSPGTVQRSIHCAQVRIGMGVGARLAAMFAQVVCQRLGRTVPAGSDARAAVPETRAGKVLAWHADEGAWRVVECHLDAGGSSHAHRLPIFDRQALARVR
ncbi:hypothetical protein D3C80_1549710 [compost metagenome]